MMASNTITVYLLLGTNVGDRLSLLEQAAAYIGKEAGKILNTSAVYETAAWGNENQPDYLNQVLCVKTSLPPQQLLEKINAIEASLGRQRKTKWEPRPMDIDILLYGDQVIQTARLQVPHPLLPDRRFALVPLREIAPDLRHPVLHLTITDLLKNTSDPLTVKLHKTATK